MTDFKKDEDLQAAIFGESTEAGLRAGHVSPNARPPWVDLYKDQGSEQLWNLYYHRAEIDAVQLVDILRERGWLPEDWK